MKARTKIRLSGLGIVDTRIRWAANGEALIEVARVDHAEKADSLAVKLREILQGDATISRPVVKGELQLWGIDDLLTTRDVASAIADIGDCEPTNMKVGLNNKMRNGLGSVWVQCPLTVAVKVAKCGSRIRIGWSTVRVELMRTRPKQCFRCWQTGHTKTV